MRDDLTRFDPFFSTADRVISLDRKRNASLKLISELSPRERADAVARMPLVQTIISDVVTPRERGQYQAYFSGVWVAAGIGGPILGGVFAEHLHWSMIFWINVPLALLGLGLLLPRMSASLGIGDSWMVRQETQRSYR